MEVIYCKKCHETKRTKNYDVACKEIKTAMNIDEVDDYCMSYCGPGTKEHFAVVDDEIISSTSYEGLIDELKELE